MNRTALKLTIGSESAAGRKTVNQDYCQHAHRSDFSGQLKGVVVALADGISSSDVSQEASQAAVEGFIEDYYSTPESWSVKTSAIKVLSALNAWLFSQTQRSEHRYDKDKGYVCTFSGAIFKSHTMHLFHIGDSRVYLRQGNTLEPLTRDHRLYVTEEKSYLSRALGADSFLDADYSTHRLNLGDTYILASDGVYEWLNSEALCDCIDRSEGDLNRAAKEIIHCALENGSTDNATVLIVRVDELPELDSTVWVESVMPLPFSQPLTVPTQFEGFQILRELHANHRSHVYLAQDLDNQALLALKIPSIDQKHDPLFMERFVLEEWIAKRINHPHVLKAYDLQRERHFIYTVMEYVDGKNLTQWLRDDPSPSLHKVRDIIGQVVKGLQSFHRLEMVHQDIRPENILLDEHGTVTLIDFGATSVAGFDELDIAASQHLLGTAMYMAPEYFIGELADWRADQFSLGVLTYFLLSGEYPYGVDVAKATTRTAQYRLRYRPIISDNVPMWLNEPLARALQLNPDKRFSSLSEFFAALSQPSRQYLSKKTPPLLERDPIKFWKGTSLLLFILLMVSLVS
jgi:serine/threonine protein phosphatase PrpC/tRNA A-37 threonylcarbamoyl transferase component Bud32